MTQQNPSCILNRDAINIQKGVLTMERLRVLAVKEEAGKVERWLQSHGARNLQRITDDAGDFVWFWFDGPKSPGRKRKIDKGRILALRGENLSYAQIAEAVGCTRGYVQHVVDAARKGDE